MFGPSSNRTRFAGAAALVAGVMTALAVSFTPAAEAREIRGPVEVHRGHQGHGGNHGVRYVAVPRHVHGAYWGDIHYRYAGRSYYGPHHHYHTVYRFPVLVGGVVTYRPYYYCNDALFVTASAPLPQVAIGFNFNIH